LVQAFCIFDISYLTVFNNQMKITAMSHRFVTEAIDLFVFDKGQIKVGGEFLIEG